MSDGKNALKLPGDHTEFNLNLKIILSYLCDAQKPFMQKKLYLKLLIFWSHLFRPTFPSDTKYRGTREYKLWVKGFI